MLEDRLFAELQAKGFTCLEGALDPQFLEACRAQVEGLIERHGDRFFSIVQPYKSEAGAFAQLAETPGFVDLLRNLARRGHSAAAADDFELYNVLRVIGGREATKGSFEFHYDATVVTVLVPLYIPDGAPGTTGELVAQPNRRGYRGSSIVNIAEKALLQNPLAFEYYRRRYGAGHRDVIQLQPGNLYFFWGYRTFHGNLPCETGKKRATLIFHFGDPHAGDGISSAILKLRKLREQRRLKAA